MKTVLGVVVLLGAASMVDAEAPSAVALRNARIVTVSGPVIAKGTVLLRDGTELRVARSRRDAIRALLHLT